MGGASTRAPRGKIAGLLRVVGIGIVADLHMVIVTLLTDQPDPLIHLSVADLHLLLVHPLVLLLVDLFLYELLHFRCVDYLSQ